MSRRLALVLLLGTAACGSPGLEQTVDQAVLDPRPGLLRMAPLGDYDFGQVSPQAPRVEGQIKLWVEGDVAVRVTGITLDRSTSRAFTLPADLPVPVELQPGDEALVGLWFEPYAVGDYFGDVQVEVVEDGNPNELSLSLQGVGCVDSDGNGRCD